MHYIVMKIRLSLPDDIITVAHIRAHAFTSQEMLALEK